MRAPTSCSAGIYKDAVAGTFDKLPASAPTGRQGLRPYPGGHPRQEPLHRGSLSLEERYGNARALRQARLRASSGATTAGGRTPM